MVQNTNLINQSLNYTSRHEAQGPSEYRRVMQRRKSRQSTFAPVAVDFDYAGDCGKFDHIFKARNSTNGSPNASQLNFEMKLRGYRNDTDFKADRPWLVPFKREFSPSQQYESVKEQLNRTIGDYKFKFNDQLYERNSNMLRSI